MFCVWSDREFGSEIVKELLSRGHTVTGVSRNVSSLKTEKGLSAKADDLSKVDATAAISKARMQW